MSETRGYSRSARVIHWLMAIIMITMIIAGLWMVNGPWDGFPPLRGQLFDYHRGMGIVLLGLVIIRIFIKFTAKPPSPLPSSIPERDRKIAGRVHFIFYAALILMPLVGWYATNAWGVKKISVFGLFDLPTLVEKNRPLGDQLLAIHGYIGFIIAGLIVLHIAAALRHHFIKKDGVLMRMLKG